MGLLPKHKRNKLSNTMLAHKDVCIGCGIVFDNEELHSVQDNETNQRYAMCEPCIERKAKEVHDDIVTGSIQHEFSFVDSLNESDFS